MVHSLVRPRIGAIGSAIVVAAVIWVLADLEGLARLWTTGLAIVVAFLTFNATTMVLEDG